MNVDFQRAVDRWVGVPLCRVLSGVDRLRGERPAAKPPNRILVILLSEMGSMVLAQPMFAQLKRQFPGASVHVLAFARNREMLELLGVVPGDNIVTLDDGTPAGFAGECLSALRRLRALNIDAVIDCELFARVSSIFSYLSGAPVRAGFHRLTQEGLYRGSFINRPVPYNPYRHLSLQYLALAAALESTTVPLTKDAPDPGALGVEPFVFDAGELAQAAGQLEHDFPVMKDRRVVLVHPSGGILPIRAWPLEHYRELCAGLIAEGCAVGVIGLPEDVALGQALVSRCGSPLCVNLTGYTVSLRHLLALFHRASLLVTNDGGPGQFAALTPVPTILFFGPETPALYRPHAPNIHCLYLAIPCSPCLSAYNHRTSPCDGDNQCLKRILPTQVLAKAREMIGAGALSIPPRHS